MTEIVGVKFNSSGRMYYFSPGDLTIEKGESVIVETARGTEYGTVTMRNVEVEDDKIVKPLKKVVRKATEEDEKRHEQNMSQKEEAKRICREKIKEHGLEMKLIDVEYTFDNNKIIFYFTADGRVDFRELVVDLASVFHMRIELRQIGVRDEARMMGGIGCCGRDLCCASWLRDFQLVSIKMAKTQGLSLNPTKISGVCGRLLCCLNFENDTYLELKKGLPDLNERVQTEKGLGKAIDTDIIKGTVKVRLFSGETDDNGNEKLDTDIYVFRKQDVMCLGKGTFKSLGEVPEFVRTSEPEDENSDDDVDAVLFSDGGPVDEDSDVVEFSRGSADAGEDGAGEGADASGSGRDGGNGGSSAGKDGSGNAGSGRNGDNGAGNGGKDGGNGDKSGAGNGGNGAGNGGNGAGNGAGRRRRNRNRGGRRNDGRQRSGRGDRDRERAASGERNDGGKGESEQKGRGGQRNRRGGRKGGGRNEAQAEKAGQRENASQQQDRGQQNGQGRRRRNSRGRKRSRGGNGAAGSGNADRNEK
jgi:cell fate regulator YaaT (PSP1 superfamily)